MTHNHTGRKRNDDITYFEAGLDIENKINGELNKNYINYKKNLYDKNDIIKSFMKFQYKQLEEYKKLDEFEDFVYINTFGKSIEDINNKIYNSVKLLLDKKMEE